MPPLRPRLHRDRCELGRHRVARALERRAHPVERLVGVVDVGLLLLQLGMRHGRSDGSGIGSTCEARRQSGLCAAGHEPGGARAARQDRRGARLRLGVGGRGVGHRRRHRARVARRVDDDDQGRLGDHADPGPHAGEHGDDRSDARPDVGRPLHPRPRHVGAAGGRGLARAAVGQAAREDARVRRARPHGAAPRGRSSTTASTTASRTTAPARPGSASRSS